jgi:hypothetical protein
MAFCTLAIRPVMVHREGVVGNRYVAPIIRIVTLGALPAIVIVGLILIVARLAIRLPGVVESGILPRVRVVALRALTAIVIIGLILVVAGLAIRLPGVVESGILPRVRVVTL